ncbi:hypothetical protein PHYBLDRAFT_145408 [Phycomyces blakesleeanus NRRL 1555(-)]|uniref:Uncharacterized protein n=1 Tax=Phycomyces blakesleeanus (strain ATCC 8743b / DSM 1359 / FGSC 10004 / NBRC 33097 / NRRL 1555) TaxID=763407 RepID=A0A162UBW4_PHYB8|nr:hypothetical protein PHYBLDRAFT_145408 [Phycomyces blakesleeanus NRRL 1555(-)]OAD73943.1 hypothetical protein PHYBLDRAFT_145408 [Phycomyces blakesleeanus NRRL 1555(-)]|eukprot:XP_018291983.1 hypothetical protein PHYBLDRAFT_145408 [Phycomyces blakesleeanus NRRL 1555(-)]
MSWPEQLVSEKFLMSKLLQREGLPVLLGEALLSLQQKALLGIVGENQAENSVDSLEKKLDTLEERFDIFEKKFDTFENTIDKRMTRFEAEMKEGQLRMEAAILRYLSL